MPDALVPARGVSGFDDVPAGGRGFGFGFAFMIFGGVSGLAGVKTTGDVARCSNEPAATSSDFASCIQL